ncbi:uncharacterized protein DS421_18g620350 [Arachis hypogaea]|nr:uncharacterized protein DS421_18g620350 [Arachis hypogaea]
MKISFYICILLLAIFIGFGSRMHIITEAKDCICAAFDVSCAFCWRECMMLYGIFARSSFCDKTSQCFCRVKC